MPLSTAEIRAAARARAKAATEALPELQAARESAEAERQRAEEALSEANRALSAARQAVAICDATPSAALALIRLTESAPHLIDALKAQRAKRLVSVQDHAAMVRRKLVTPSLLGQGAQITPLTSLGAQVVRLHTEIQAMTTTGPRTILAPGEYVTPSGCVYRALVRVRVGEPGDRHTPPSPHEAERLQPGSVTITDRDGESHAVGDLAVPHYVRTRIETIALSRLPAPGAPPSAWERWHEKHGTP